GFEWAVAIGGELIPCFHYFCLVFCVMRIRTHRDQAIGGGLRSGWSTDEAFTTGTPEGVPNTAAIKRADTKKRQQHTTTVNAHLIRVTKPESLNWQRQS
ncbi:hypothetical protein, partial [Pseudomonas brassicacearum]|uniref:hypothetical protein n=1 Tax=Pseudomonas brassicacearum TaxID=930166 RepID=UPI001C83448A